MFPRYKLILITTFSLLSYYDDLFFSLSAYTPTSSNFSSSTAATRTNFSPNVAKNHYSSITQFLSFISTNTGTVVAKVARKSTNRTNSPFGDLSILDFLLLTAALFQFASSSFFVFSLVIRFCRYLLFVFAHLTRSIIFLLFLLFSLAAQIAIYLSSCLENRLRMSFWNRFRSQPPPPPTTTTPPSTSTSAAPASSSAFAPFLPGLHSPVSTPVSVHRSTSNPALHSASHLSFPSIPNTTGPHHTGPSKTTSTTAARSSSPKHVSFAPSPQSMLHPSNPFYTPPSFTMPPQQHHQHAPRQRSTRKP